MNSQADTRKRFYIHTLGCKVNQYESQAMREILLRAGFTECLSRDIADIYILNTCTVTHHADREARYLIGMLHRANPKAKIAVVGCYVERNADDVSNLPGVAYIVKNEEKNRIDKILSGEPVISGTDDTCLSITGFKDRTKAFVKIQDGCENRCSYCKVPLVRGVLKSKPIDKIVEEVGSLVSGGFKELILSGICLGAWGKDVDSTPRLIDVLKILEDMDGDFRIRLSSIELKYVTGELIDLIKSSRKICRHLHIPLQSGDDDILRRMNRPYTSAEYQGLIDRTRRDMEAIAISTDVMVGFPGETDNNFKNTLNLLKAIMPSRTHIFTFSKRNGTPASRMDGEIPEDIAKRRYYALRTVSLMLSYMYRYKFLSKKLKVLVEAKRDRHSGLLSGYSDNYMRVLFEGPDDLMGRVVQVKLDDLTLSYTKGQYVDE